MDIMLISRFFLKLLGFQLSRWSIDALKKFQNIKIQKKRIKKEIKNKKSRWQFKKMCLSCVNLDILTLELDMKVQFANF
jgi:hypothetical protein